MKECAHVTTEDAQEIELPVCLHQHGEAIVFRLADQ